MKKQIILFIIIIGSLLSCNKINKADFGRVSFSNDTVFFDTIFTQVGSTTKIFEVYNSSNKAIKLNKIFLAGGNNSSYRLNIDGTAANSVDNVIIDSKDSLFIFVEVTINSGIDDLLEEDSIIFLSGNNRQRIILDAVGKDVHLINGRILQTQTWTADKPYLIYNSVLIDTLQTLTLEPGVEIYSHRNSNIYVKGTLIVKGNKDKIVTFSGDRIDDDYYKNKPGQWGGIIFLPGSHDNNINYAKISESIIGTYVDSMLTDVSPTLSISNTEISHCSYAGIYALNTNIEGYNLVVSDCGVHDVGLFMSGKYKFYHCTFQNDYSASVRNTPAVGIQNYTKDKNNNKIYGGLISASFANSIIYGNLKNEFLVSSYNTAHSIDFSVENCLMKIDASVIDTTLPMYKNIISNKDPEYIEKDKFDFHLSSNSPAIGKANLQIDNDNASFLQFDIDGIDRLAAGNKPDIGAYEYVSN